MNKSKSFPELSEDIVQPMRKSKSLSGLNERDDFFEEFFEGDGVLGIVFTTLKGRIVVNRIEDGTVASETYGLETMMELVEVNNENIEHLSFNKTMVRIHKLWKKGNCIFLKFKKEFYPEISKTLYKNDIDHFYDQFIELGAKENTDFEYIEIGDLLKMGMKEHEITCFKNINPHI